MTRKICVVTGTRAEYGLMKPVMEKIQKHKDMVLSLIVTGMHLSPEFGHSIDEIEEDGFKIDAKVDMLLAGDNQVSMAKSVGLGIIGISQALETIKPDIVLILGDRVEALAAAISAAYMNIPIAHIGGGDTAIGSNIDDSIRHAITKLAHIHFPATQKHAQRIIKLGENPEYVYCVGATGLDSILNKKLIEKEKIAEEFDLDLSKPILLVVQHPTTIESNDAPIQIRKTLDALIEIGEQTIIIYPNADAGGIKMIKVIEQYRNYPFIKIYKNLKHDTYLSLMKVSNVMVGNSSSGIIEAPSFNLPVVNIGSRQKGRERSENVIDVGYDKNEIIHGIKKALYDKEFKEKVKNCKNPYGDGTASDKIVKILSEIKIDKKLLQKKITY